MAMLSLWRALGQRSALDLFVQGTQRASAVANRRLMRIEVLCARRRALVRAPASRHSPYQPCGVFMWGVPNLHDVLVCAEPVTNPASTRAAATSCLG